MKTEKIILSLLSFGETGMEFIRGQFHDALDEDHITLIGNFYSNVLGAAKESSGLFGPLPVAYKYDILLFLYAFNAYDPNLMDERVIKRKNMTRAMLLIFFPSVMDGVFSNQRNYIRSIIEKWALKNELNDIRKTSVDDINNLKENISSLIIHQINREKFSSDLNSNIFRATGKNLNLLETLANIHNFNLKLKFVSNVNNLENSLKKIIFNELYDNIKEYSNSNNSAIYKLNKVDFKSYINIHNIFSNGISLKEPVNGLFFFFSDSNNENDLNLIESILRILRETPKESVLSFCFQLDKGVSEIINNESISNALIKENDRSISLINLKDHNHSIEFALIDFFEKIITRYF